MDMMSKMGKMAMKKPRAKKAPKTMAAMQPSKMPPFAMKKGGEAKMRDGGMAMRKGYADGGMPMVMKEGKKVPSFAADGRGKMKHGGMAHDAKAKKGRGMAIMIAIGKPKGRGKS